MGNLLDSYEKMEVILLLDRVHTDKGESSMSRARLRDSGLASMHHIRLRTEDRWFQCARMFYCCDTTDRNPWFSLICI
jgi:hypothetical protein